MSLLYVVHTGDDLSTIEIRECNMNSMLGMNESNQEDMENGRAFLRKLIGKGKAQITRWGYLKETWWQDSIRELNDFLWDLDLTWGDKQELNNELAEKTLELGW